MKKTRIVLSGALLTVSLLTGSHVGRETASAQSEPAPECTCVFPETNQYGVLRRLPQPLPSGERDTCEVKRCYKRLSEGGEDLEMLQQ